MANEFDVTFVGNDRIQFASDSEFTVTFTRQTLAPQGGIDDEHTTSTSTWSSQKISNELNEKADKVDTVLDTTLSRGRKANTTIGSGSFAFGYNATASGDYAHSEGYSTTASGFHSHAEGDDTVAYGPASHAEGEGSGANGFSSHAEGCDTRAYGNYSHSEGNSTTANAENSHAEGYETVANRKSQHVFGEFNIVESGSSSTRGTYIEIVGNGDELERSNARTLDWSGNEELAGDLTVLKGTDGEVSVSELKSDIDGKITEPATEGTAGQVLATNGNGTRYWTTVSSGGGGGGGSIDVDTAMSSTSTNPVQNKVIYVAMENKANASDLSAKADKADTVLTSTLSRGRKANTTVGTGSFAFGFNVTSSSDYSHAEGAKTVASGWYAHAEGAETTASAATAHAEGSGSVASDSSAHAEGQNTTASKYSAHSEGRDSVAGGIASHAEGIGTIANHKAQHVFGEYNTEDNSSATAANRGNYVEIVGNGNANDARSNARTLDWDGNEELSGNLTINKGTANEKSMTELIGDLDDKADKADTVLTSTLSRGRKSGSTVGAGSFAFGNDPTASGQYTHAEGSETIASGTNAHAEGFVTNASGTYAHAEGSGIKASVGGSTTYGYTTASGNASHAEGFVTTASGMYSHSEGSNTVSNHRSQHVFGEYNVEDDSSAAATARGKYVEIVGNGTAGYARSNARTLDWDGNEVLAGDLTIHKGTANEISVTSLAASVDEKQDAPAVAGTAGQVLGLDSNLLPVWMNQSGGGGSVTLNYVTPEDYGAYGDGTHDDSTAIQQAFNSGLPVVLTKNKNYFILQVSVSSPLMVIGNQATISTRAITAEEYQNGKQRMIIINTVAKYVCIRDVNFITTCDQTVNGAHGTRDPEIPNRSIRCGIACYGIDMFTLENCRFENFDNPVYGQKAGGDSNYENILQNAWIKNCKFYNCLMGMLGHFRHLVVDGCEYYEDHNARSGEHCIYIIMDAMETCNIVNSNFYLMYAPMWRSNTQYRVGQYVRINYQDNENNILTDVYSCAELHTSGNTFDSTKWTLVENPNGDCGSCIQFYPTSLSAKIPTVYHRDYTINNCTFVGDAYISNAGGGHVYANSCVMKTINYNTTNRRRQFECTVTNGGTIEVNNSSVNLELQDGNNSSLQNIILRNCDVYSTRKVTDRMVILKAYDCYFDNVSLTVPDNAEYINCTFSSSVAVTGRYYITVPSTTTTSLFAGCMFKTGVNVNNIAYGCVGTCLMVDIISALPNGTDNPNLTIYHKIDPNGGDSGGGGGGGGSTSVYVPRIENNMLCVFTSAIPSDGYQTIYQGTYTIQHDSGDDYSYIYNNNVSMTIAVGDVFKVNWNGTESTLTAKAATIQGEDMVVIGNPGVVDSTLDDDSGIRYMGYMYNDHMIVFALDNTTDTHVAIVLKKKVA